MKNKFIKEKASKYYSNYYDFTERARLPLMRVAETMCNKAKRLIKHLPAEEQTMIQDHATTKVINKLQ